MKHHEVDMLSGSIVKGLLAMTLPIMVMNLSQSLFSVIDMTVLGKLVNDDAVGAVGACGMLITLINSLMIGISAGANVVVAKHLGRGHRETVERAVGTSVLFSLVGGGALTILGLCCARVFLRWVNCPESLMDQAVLYFRIYFCGVPVLMLYNFCVAVLRATGDTRRPMVYLIIGGVSKIVLNFSLITLFDMTVEGVAIATILSNLIAGGLAFLALWKHEDLAPFRFRHLRLYGPELKEILYIGVPTGLQSAMYSLANVVISATVNSFGAAATKGISIANQFDNILYQICHAPSLATISYVAQNIGAHNVKRANRSVARAMLITVAFGATFGAMSALFSAQLSSLMSSDPEVIRFSQQKMVIISSTYFICGINEVLCAALRGIGRPLVPTITALVFTCILRFVWVYLIFPLIPNMTFLYLVWPVGWTLSIFTMLFFYFPKIRQLKEQYPVPKSLT